MSGLVSIVTPVHAPAARWLRNAYESLRAQQLPGGWAWEWLVQGDGWVVPADSEGSCLRATPGSASGMAGTADPGSPATLRWPAPGGTL